LLTLVEEQRRKEILESIERMAVALERTAGTLRYQLTSSANPAEKVEQVQHELAWLFPNLGAHQLTHAAIEWTTNQREAARLLAEGIEPPAERG
jgi:hypothetical protein